MADTYILYTLTDAYGTDGGTTYTFGGTFVVAYDASGNVDDDATIAASGYDVTVTYGGNTYPTVLTDVAQSDEPNLSGATADNAFQYGLAFQQDGTSLDTNESFFGDFASFDNGGTLTETVVCFCAGTLIATADGATPVEDLVPGDPILTDSGDYLPVLWIGRQTIALADRDPLRNAPIRLQAGAIAEGLPARDLTVSPAHAFLIDGMLVEAGALVNDTTIAPVRGLREVTYYHVELATHALVFAEGMLAESFVDNIERDVFDNAPVRREPILEMDYPRARALRQLPASLRTRLGLTESVPALTRQG